MWRSTKSFTPPTDVVELSDHVLVLVEVAGMEAEDINITLLNDNLIINGVRRRPSLETQAYHRVEIGFGEFRLEIPITWSIQQDAVNARYQDGFLYINLPRLPERTIQITHNKEQDMPDV